MKKLLISVLVIVCILASTTSVFATEVTRSSSSFTSAWELSATGTGWEMVYGFNTFLFDEDYVHSNHSTNPHTSIVTHNGHSHSASGGAWDWANVDVMHEGSTVTYKMIY